MSFRGFRIPGGSGPCFTDRITASPSALCSCSMNAHLPMPAARRTGGGVRNANAVSSARRDSRPRASRLAAPAPHQPKHARDRRDQQRDGGRLRHRGELHKARLGVIQPLEQAIIGPGVNQCLFIRYRLPPGRCVTP